MSDLVSIRKSSENNNNNSNNKKRRDTQRIFPSTGGKSAPSTPHSIRFSSAHVFAVILHRLFFFFSSLSRSQAISILFIKISCIIERNYDIFDPLCLLFFLCLGSGCSRNSFVFFYYFHIATACALTSFHVSYIIYPRMWNLKLIEEGEKKNIYKEQQSRIKMLEECLSCDLAAIMCMIIKNND